MCYPCVPEACDLHAWVCLRCAHITPQVCGISFQEILKSGILGWIVDTVSGVGYGVCRCSGSVGS